MRNSDFSGTVCVVMVAVAQLAEHSVVVRAVEGSSPFGHPQNFGVKETFELPPESMEGFSHFADINGKVYDVYKLDLLIKGE